MILAKEKHSWSSGKGYSITSHGWRYRVQCDNPDCGKVFYRKETEVNKAAKIGNKKQYCNALCMFTHFAGVCEHPGCDQKYTYRSIVCGKGNKLCPKHNKIKIRKENQRIYRKRNKDKLYDILGNRCVCCGEKDRMYLEVDHVHNDGKKHREKISRKYTRRWKDRAGTLHPRHYMSYLEDNPNGLQLLCSNCNRAKAKNGGELYRPDKFTRRKLL